MSSPPHYQPPLLPPQTVRQHITEEKWGFTRAHAAVVVTLIVAAVVIGVPLLRCVIGPALMAVTGSQ